MAFEIFIQERHNCFDYHQCSHLPLPPSGLLHFLFFIFFLSPNHFRFCFDFPSGYILILRNFSGFRSKVWCFSDYLVMGLSMDLFINNKVSGLLIRFQISRFSVSLGFTLLWN